MMTTSPSPHRTLCALLWFLILSMTGIAQQANPSRVGQLTGRVVDQRGDAVSGARVTATVNGGLPHTTTTGSDGRFTFASLPVGEYELRVSAAGFSEQTRRVTVPDEGPTRTEAGLELTLEAARLTHQITVTPARAERRLDELPASVTVLDSRDVSHAAAQTVDDLLRQVPGFSIFRRSSSLVANPTTQGVSLRGAGASGASRTLVLTDGLPLNDAFGGWVYWDRVPRAAIDRIELLRGGASDLYGSDALSGVINVITRPPTQRAIHAEASYGTRDTYDLSFFASERRGGWSASLAGEAMKTDGYFIIAPEQRGAADQPAASKHRLLTLRLEHQWNAENAIFARGSLFDEDRKNGTRLQINDTATESLAVGGRARSGDGSYWNLALFANQQRFHQDFSAVAAGRATETITRRQAVPSRDAGLSLNWSRLTAARHLLVAGLDVRGVRGTSDEVIFSAGQATSLVSAGGRQRRIGLFAQDILTLSARWQLTVSARYDHWRDSSAASVTRTFATGNVQPRFFAPRTEDAFSPRLALLFRATNQLSLRAAAYRAFRAPTLNELYRSFRVGDTLTQANEKLRAERLTGGEAGASWTLNERLSARLTGYWTETVNPITNFTLSVTPTLITRERRNLGRTRSRGIEAEADYHLSNRWRFSSGYLFAEATVRRAPQDTRLEGLLIPQVPRHQFTLQASYSHPSHLTAAVQLRSSGKQFDDDQNRLPLGGFTVVDTLISRPLSRYFEVFLAVQNIFDTRYAVGRTPIETIGAPRLLRGGLRLRLER
jgi:outer membrane receptor protein involved in Fe transport